jgi:VanZ family protein
MLLLYWTAIFALTHWPEIDRYGPSWKPPYFDKVVHFCMYAGWATVWCWVLSAGGQQVRNRAVYWLLAGGAAYAIFDEVSQAVVDRDPSVGDFAADVLGIVLATAVFQWWQQRRAAGIRR